MKSQGSSVRWLGLTIYLVAVILIVGYFTEWNPVWMILSAFPAYGLWYRLFSNDNKDGNGGTHHSSGPDGGDFDIGGNGGE